MIPFSAEMLCLGTNPLSNPLILQLFSLVFLSQHAHLIHLQLFFSPSKPASLLNLYSH
jgi:hypothetical protein